ncbi:MAG: hypothetical protein RLZZ292_842, partial [Bacteroidota bacterium]
SFVRSNWQIINPAAIHRILTLGGNSAKNNPSAMASINYREQWFRIDNTARPRVFHASVEAPFGENIRIGGVVVLDRVGAFSTTDALVNCTYRLRIGERNNINYIDIGINVGLNRQKIANLSDNQNNQPDAIFDQYPNKNAAFSSGLGIMYRHNQAYYLGFSFPKMMRWNQKGRDANLLDIAFIAGTYMDYSDYPFLEKLNAHPIIEPTIILRSTRNQQFYPWGSKKNSPLSIDFNVRTYIWDKIWWGIGYGTNQNLSAEMAWTKRYEIATSGSSEATNNYFLGLNLNYPVGKKSIRLGPSVELTAGVAW